MVVSDILAEKGKDVVTHLPGVSLKEAAETLASKKIGAVVITGRDGKIAGILSERDIVRAVARHGSNALIETADRFMTKDVITCTQGDTINLVMEKMTAGRFRHMPIVDGEKLAGLISIGDVVKRRIMEIENEAEQMRSYIAAV